MTRHPSVMVQHGRLGRHCRRSSARHGQARSTPIEADGTQPQSTAPPLSSPPHHPQRVCDARGRQRTQSFSSIAASAACATVAAQHVESGEHVSCLFHMGTGQTPSHPPPFHLHRYIPTAEATRVQTRAGICVLPGSVFRSNQLSTHPDSAAEPQSKPTMQPLRRDTQPLSHPHHPLIATTATHATSARRARGGRARCRRYASHRPAPPATRQQRRASDTETPGVRRLSRHAGRPTLPPPTLPSCA